MLSKEERRYLRYWEDQRKDGKWKYITLYGIAWLLMMLTFLFIFLIVLTDLLKNEYAGVLIIAGSLVLSFLLASQTWSRSEKKFKSIIRREINAGNKEDLEIDAAEEQLTNKP